MVNEKEALKILIVDDNELDLDILESSLVSQGFRNIIKTDSSTEAFRLAKRHQPDLIITDIIMPELDGARLREKLKETPVTRRIPVIYASGIITKEEERQFGGELPAGDFLIAKPYSEDEIIRVMNLALGGTNDKC